MCVFNSLASSWVNVVPAIQKAPVARRPLMDLELEKESDDEEPLVKAGGQAVDETWPGAMGAARGEASGGAPSLHRQAAKPRRALKRRSGGQA